MSNAANSPAVNNPGDLDPSFGVEGVVQIPSGSGTIRCMVEDEQGAIVHGVWVRDEIWLYRIFADGSADPGFGEEGVTKWGFAPRKVSVPVQLLIQADGKYVLIGSLRNVMDDRQSQVALTRFNSNGTPDLVFGNKVLPLPAEDHVLTELPSYGCLQPDGKILVAAPYMRLDQEGNVIYKGARLYRLQTNGEQDLEFGGGQGFIELRFNGQNTAIKSIENGQDGKILVAGTLEISGSRQSIARFTSLGALDETFGRQGYWQAKDSTFMGRIILDDEQRIIVVGTEGAGAGEYHACISRLTADGEFDKTFNNGSSLLVDIPVSMPREFVTCSSVAVQADGKIIAAGYAGLALQSYWLRVQPSGVLDPGFGEQGIRVHEPAHVLGGALVQRNAQRILVALDSAELKPKILGILS
ncbi:Delta-60 repeat protein [Pseudomonas sp. IT-347P]|uniref:hypothetical protein n=1 Tax=Pseudomonas sp. IT-347P TaxID=3026458 RepID=UPI0039E101A5